MENDDSLYLCYTTVSRQEDAETLAKQIIDSKLAACVQIDAHILSYYNWKGKTERDNEIRLQIFAPGACLSELEKFVTERHPYDIPKWICWESKKVSEKYLKWANEVCNLRGFI
ncbi:divalent-cation tolerance protein CutA [Pelagicoccus albus]|uniref:Divalent-cation tolerance protein CutA n=1 Tax=Pelagicoccus albus TaxID=415222 RepID=A0A7X1E7S3_9BACT|nr:divalent-cation tolerance protein CutA [Pelagicoccus albus]MBC2605496.1 divalent-cation tolerance protein CutA [Pelagicoccus albus]